MEKAKARCPNSEPDAARSKRKVKPADMFTKSNSPRRARKTIAEGEQALHSAIDMQSNWGHSTPGPTFSTTHAS